MTQSLVIVGAALLIKLEKKSWRGEESVRVLMPYRETSMEMKKLIGRTLLIVTVWTRLQLLQAQPIWSDCGQTECINGGDFQRNVIQVLESLSGNASTSGFNTSHVEGKKSNSTVYGFVVCRGDLNSSDCKACASAAKENLLKECINGTSGFAHLDLCFLRYDHHNFYNDYNDERSELKKICNNIANITVEALSKLIEKTVKSRTPFGTDKYNTGYPDILEIYSLAQCWNPSPANCQSCLATGRSILSGPGRSIISSDGYESGALGGRYLSMYCTMRY